jgi:hypothetical protein
MRAVQQCHHLAAIVRGSLAILDRAARDKIEHFRIYFGDGSVVEPPPQTASISAFEMALKEWRGQTLAHSSA